MELIEIARDVPLAEILAEDRGLIPGRPGLE